MILAGNLTVVEALVLFAVFTVAFLPFAWLAVRRAERLAFDRHLRARGARPAGEVLPRQRGDAIVDVDPDLEDLYGTVRILNDEHRPNPTDN
jgi:hypothetical protein